MARAKEEQVGDQGRSGGGESRGQGRGGKHRGGKPGGPRAGKPTGKPGGPRAGKPTGKPGGPRAGKPTGKPGGRPGARAGDAPRRPTPRRLEQSQERPERPRDPRIPDHIQADQLDPSVANELRTLPEDLAERVARRLAAADEALVEGDIDAARAQVAVAKRIASRVAAVREAAGIAAYLAGDYAEAVGDLRAARRMRGSQELVPMLADCERGLGRPERALDLIREVDASAVDQETRVELALVAAGARADLGQVDAGLLILQGSEFTRLPSGGLRARVEYARSELLAAAGREAEAAEWLRRAAQSDTDGVTDAAERLEYDADLLFEEDVQEEFEEEAGQAAGDQP